MVKFIPWTDQFSPLEELSKVVISNAWAIDVSLANFGI